MTDRSDSGSTAQIGRLVILRTSPRVAPGLLTADAWSELRASRVIGGRDSPLVDVLRAAGVSVEIAPESAPAARASGLLQYARQDGRCVVWLAEDDDEPELSATVAARLSAADAEQRPNVEVLVGSYDLPGARLLDLVAVMDRLRSPGGCPWDAKQTHRTLAPFLLEETYEALAAIDADDAASLADELGDLLLQVVFHSRIAEESSAAWSIDDVAAGIIDKLIRRHPHVFADADASTPEEVEQSWQRLKMQEGGRTSVLDGMPTALPALALADSVLRRLDRSGIDADRLLSAGSDGSAGSAGSGVDAPSLWGERLLRLVVEARHDGVDAESVLRQAVTALAERVRAAEPPRDPGDEGQSFAAT